MVARWDGDRLTLWDSTQAPNWVQIELANLFKLPSSDVRVIVGTLGGGYGGKIDPSIEPIAAWLAQQGAAARSASRSSATRSSSRTPSTPRGCGSGPASSGTARSSRTRRRVGTTAARTPRRRPRRSRAATRPWARTACRTSRVDSFGVYTNITPSAAFRGFGIPQMSLGARVADGRHRRRAGHGPARAPAAELPRARRPVLDRRDDHRGSALHGAAQDRGREDRLVRAATARSRDPRTRTRSGPRASPRSSRA